MVNAMWGRPMPGDPVTPVSDYDADYVGGGHGGVPVNGLYDAAGPEAVDNVVIELAEGPNDVPLVFVRSIHNIHNIRVELTAPPGAVSGRRYRHKVEITKSSFAPRTRPHVLTKFSFSRNISLMDVRTLFVAYRDTYTTLKVDVSSPARLYINVPDAEDSTDSADSAAESEE